MDPAHNLKHEFKITQLVLMNSVTLKIDNCTIETKPGDTILEAALKNGIYIPNLCHHPDLKPAGVCRLCMVDIGGRGRVMSCLTPVEQDISVMTETPEISRIRRMTVTLHYSTDPRRTFKPPFASHGKKIMIDSSTIDCSVRLHWFF